MPSVLERVKKDLPGFDISNIVGDTEAPEATGFQEIFESIKLSLDNMSEGDILGLVRSILEYKNS